MAEWAVLYKDTIQRIDADEVEHQPDDGVFVFLNARRQMVAWVREDDVRAVALRSVIGNP